ncbi:hypothetical protein E5E91_15070 [Deinococcus radiodurans R1 = ATCC 13939 = DSM 20539]|uniref:Uncharacterized protein n=1 Tax=Deinococcus radiodurans (strain ATCC 13939 / DSM 20539 / JCM 16871 / CCUG 27074 / LMG 4051 / NBRC 15346 / NCIMB 9279 / VKM B-1422 / R1) TaxID=243230 RepID=Q9RYN2_DEIRA|nr:hypothetical protein DR_A0278 [Deinococcus radiodurans R1 = ATCC 13939 = DSM 20539]QEM73204.1 hypothetical protein DXG80_14845 [Deinococcus radiodurans]UDL02040.1 hypothetical protein E5E91_15070 [Deinococcus radiodurans R1 = ATCC 13939 = DSM 20539]HCE64108.1 hypothetical protein [Deinococcus radiodurans]
MGAVVCASCGMKIALSGACGADWEQPGNTTNRARARAGNRRLDRVEGVIAEPRENWARGKVTGGKERQEPRAAAGAQKQKRRSLDPLCVHFLRRHSKFWSRCKTAPARRRRGQGGKPKRARYRLCSLDMREQPASFAVK